MNTPKFRNWQSVQTEVLRRIHAREWRPGDLIPNEADLALEFGCARTTVNRALRAVAETGVLDRRRKAGTRVAVQPVAKATLNIAVIRNEVEDAGHSYDYQRIKRREIAPPPSVSKAMKTPPDQWLLHVCALHLADGASYAYEDRWINPAVVPSILDENFETISANEWLLKHAPYTHGEIKFSATSATQGEADVLQCPLQSALFTIDRITWDIDTAVTSVRLLFGPGHQIRTDI
ncbi:MAG: UTRA domain-containing protein [Litoreibacter sp.]|uniref:UTRA domain-containing protein n=1 Tax=Litoreibacter sp. TaxID=1969459 RepID=UPI003299B72C